MHEIVMRLDVDEREAVVVQAPDGRLTLSERGARVGVDLPKDGSARFRVGGRIAVAGRLGRGVAAVTVIDDAGAEHAATIQDGLWMAVVDGFSEELVRYVDADGELVSTVPAGEHVAITDARDACPVCGTVRWVQVEDSGMTLITCGCCGFVVCGMGGAPVDTTGSPRRARSRSRTRGAELPKATATSAPYRIYQRAGTTARVTKQLGQGVELVSIELIDAADTVTVISSQPSRGPLAAVSLQERLTAARRPGTDDRACSLPAASIHHATERRATRRLALAVTPRTRTFTVDGQPSAFEFLDTGAGWGARREHDGVEIVITAGGVDPATVAVQRVAV